MALGAPAGPPGTAQPQFPFSLSGRAPLPPISHFSFKPCVGKVPAPHFIQLPTLLSSLTLGCWGTTRGAGVTPQKAGGTLRYVAPQPHPDNISLRRRTGPPRRSPSRPTSTITFTSLSPLLTPPASPRAVTGGLCPMGGLCSPRCRNGSGGPRCHCNPPPLRPPRAGLGSTPRQTPAPVFPVLAAYLPVGTPSVPP